MAYHRGQNSTFEFDVVVYNFYLDLQLNIQVSYFPTVLVDLTLFVSRFNVVVRSIQHSSLRNSTFNFRKYPTASQSMRVSVGSANYCKKNCKLQHRIQKLNFGPDGTPYRRPKLTTRSIYHLGREFNGEKS